MGASVPVMVSGAQLDGMEVKEVKEIMWSFNTFVLSTFEEPEDDNADFKRQAQLTQERLCAEAKARGCDAIYNMNMSVGMFQNRHTAMNNATISLSGQCV